MLLGTILTLVLTVCADLCFGKGVFSVHHYRHVPVHRNSATVRRVGNVYVFPYYSAMRRKIHRCGYGSYRLGCCAGWVRNSVAGTCTPICESGCVHGTCVAPNQCRCEPGYRGANCNADLNECGLEPRPCNHRCINTLGSYRCHCEQGYLLEEDGKTCIRDSRCFPGKCAYGCRKNGLGLECICPAGLELAKDGYHCLDIDECALGTVRCPSDQRCVNTYGNYMCLCQEGFQFRYVNGKLRCTESEDRCAQAGYVCDSNAKCQAGSGVAKCVCNRGFVGNGEECTAVELKTCSQRPCFTSVTCSTQELISTDIPYPEDGVVKLYECGPCPRGYRGDGETCEDIDECAEGTDACHDEADCENTPGFYSCVCREGFTGDGFSCFALGCNRPGVVANGEFSPKPNGPNGQYTDGTIITFQCQTGFELQGSSLSTCLKGMWTAELPVCADIDECQTGEAACHEHATCLNVPGSYRCTCNTGYTGSGILCFPLYCTVEEPVVNGQVIPPPLGEDYGDGDLVSFICDDGFLLVGPLTSVCEMGLWSNPFPQCVDVDECASSSDNDCDANALCINIPGSYRCECNEGFFGNGQVCIEIDPTTCTDGPCADDVVCTDLDRVVVLATIDLKNPTSDVISLYKCGDCPEGYHGDGATCVDIDECAENLFECDTNAQCSNLPGAYICTCNDGYYGDGKVCIPIDPTRCSDLPCFPGTSCTELDRDTVLAAVDITDPPPVIRLYECGECPQGFVGNGSYCEDVDECLLEIDNCDENAICSNAEGTYDCVCNRGFYGNGRICIPIDPTQCSDMPCFRSVPCDDLSRSEVASGIDLDNPPEIILQYECGECPPGYRGDGINCTDIDECAEDLYECHPFAMCNNLPGTFECICMDGHHGDGKTCIPMDHTVCTADGPCFESVDCTNLSRADVLSKIDLGAATPEDVIKFYLCGDCPGGYLGDGEVCLDIDECDTGDYDCHKNASCENEIGGYTCVCVDGHFGNGTHCAQLDDRSCADDPCFPGVECMDIDPTMVDYTQPFVRLFECGECPEDYSGDGIECIKDYIPPFVNLTVIVISHYEPTIDAVAPDAEISAFVADPMSQFGTEEIASAVTGLDGIARLSVPHNQTLIITASLDGHLPNSVTYKANIKQDNVVTIPLAVFEELNAFRWLTASSNSFAFGGQEGTAQYRVSIPAGGLRVRNRRNVQVEFYGVNMTIPEQVEHAPEPIASLRAGRSRGDIGGTVNGQPALTELVALDVAGIMELNIFEIGGRSGTVAIVQPVTLNIPVSSPTNEYRVGDSLDAWYYEEDHGVWVKDGTGFIEQDRDSDMLVWKYEATHFTWWAAAKPQGQTSCVKVKTCLDGACDMPVPGVRIKLTGEDYGFSTSRTTDRYAEAYFNFRHGRTVTLEAVCAMETVTVASTTLPAAFENADADIPSIILDPLLPSDVCREVTLMLPPLASNLTCPDPGDVEFSTRSLSGIEYSDVVQYNCEMGRSPPFGDGYRTCLECGLWSDQPVECINLGGSAKKRRRRRSSNQRKHDQLEDYPPERSSDHECGTCPPGYRIDGVQCTDIDECAEDLYECHPFATCKNLPGTFECICMDGHHGDGKTCILMDQTVCTADGPCFQGVDCTNLSRCDVLSKIDLGAATPEDIIKFYLCGDCPDGYLGDGEVCLDIDECDTGDYDCHENASCENEIGGYTCVCVDGHFGNGTHCAQLDDRSCADDPCFPGVECMDIDPTMVDYTQPFVRLFECGECPENYTGDGFECVKNYIPLTVIVISHYEPTIDAVAPDAEISAFVADPMSQFGTTKIASAVTGLDGIARLSVPHNQTLIITASLDGHLTNSVTYKANIKQDNVITIPLAVFEELNAFRWFTASSNSFAFGGQEGTAQYRVSIPSGGLRVRNRRNVQIEFYGVNMTISEKVEHAPEPIAMLRAGPGPRGLIGDTVNGQPALTELVALDVAGIMELNIFEIGGRSGTVAIVQPVTLNIPVSSPTDEYRVGDSLDAWYYEEDHGVWVKDGTGFIEQDRDSDMLVWMYEATHFTWWAAAKPQGQTSCVKVKTCLDGGCDMPVPGVRIKLTGEDYGFSTSRTTDRYAEAYFNFKLGRSVTLKADDAMESVTVASTTLPAAFENADADIPSIILDPLLPSDVCREVTLMVPPLANIDDTGDYDCHKNASCENEIGGYTCVCVDGHFGNGTHCVQLDDQSCADDPCFPGVECMDIDPTMVDYTQPFVRLFECGECPEDYSGDGFECIKDYIPPFVNLTVIVISHYEPTIDAVAPDAEISAFVADPMSQFGTTKIASALTGLDGIARLSVPHNQTLIITASLVVNLANSVTYKANIKQNNAVTIPLAVFEEGNAFRWITFSSNSFAFGGHEGTAQYRVSIPPAGLSVRYRRNVQIEFYGVNMTIPEQVEHAPEPIAMLRAGPGPRGVIGDIVNGQPALTELVALDVAGIMELNIFEIGGRRGTTVAILQPVTLNIPVSSPTDEYRVGDSLDAWYYEEDHGVWVKDGTGFIEQDRDSDMLVWRYEATHFTWWAAAKPQGQTSCVKVKTCLDGTCDMPVPGVRIKLTGEDYGFSTSRTTDRYAEAYFNFKLGRSVTLKADDAMESVTVASTTLPAAFENADADIPSIILDPLLPSDVCREVTLMVPPLAKDYIPPFVNLTVIVISHYEPTIDAVAPDAEISAFVADPMSQFGTTKIASALTGLDGIARLSVPHNQTLIITASLDGHLANSVTYKANIKQNNAVTIPLAVFEELNVFRWITFASNSFAFGGQEGTAQYRMSIPAGGLSVRNRRNVQIEFYGVNMTIPEQVEHAPEPIAMLRAGPGPRGVIGDTVNGQPALTELVALDVAGIMELNIFEIGGRLGTTVAILQPVTLNIPVSSPTDEYRVGDSLDAWYYEEDHGVWVKDGTGFFEQDRYSDMLVWKYEATHFTWWAAAKPQGQTSCVKVKTCLDGACGMPVPGVRIKLTGEDYGFSASRTTDRHAEAYFNFRHGRTVTLEAVCAMENVTVASTTLPAAFDNADADIPSISLDPLLPSDVCREVTLMLPPLASNLTCPDPGDVEFSTRSLSGLEYSDVVQYTCEMGRAPFFGDGYRTCLECGLWSDQPVECYNIGGSSVYG